jgi:hypothetical protein
MISSYQSLYPTMLVDLPSCPTPLVLQELQRAGRDFCKDTESWRERLDFNIVDADETGDAAYAVAIAAGQSVAAATVAKDAAHDSALKYTLRSHFDAEVVRPDRVWTDGDDKLQPMDPYYFSFEPHSSVLTFHSDLQTYSPTATTWASLTVYTAGQYVIVSSLRYICAIAHTAGTWATDLAADRWKLMTNDLLVDVILMPRLLTVELAGWYLERWGEGIVALAMSHLCAMKNKVWSSPERVTYFHEQYKRYANMAMREAVFTRDLQASSSFTVPGWIP